MKIDDIQNLPSSEVYITKDCIEHVQGMLTSDGT